MSVDRARLEALLAAERTAFVQRHPRSRAAYGAADRLLGRVPMTWMGKTAGPFPLYLAGASGARVTDLDGHELVDFCLGDTGAMAGHSARRRRGRDPPPGHRRRGDGHAPHRGRRGGGR